MVELTQVRTNVSAGTGGSSPPAGEHVVRRGELLWSIARQHGVSLDSLKAANPDLASQRYIHPGDRVTVPGAHTGSHQVRRGDTIGAIARTHGTTVDAIVQANGLRNPDLIFPGTRLTIPAAGSQPTPRPAARQDPVDTPSPANVTPPAVAPTTGLDLRAQFDPARGSSAVGAIVIGQAEGTRTPSGGFRNAYYGHIDPGNGVGNRGSFSLQNAGHLTPEQADAQQLRTLTAQIPAFEAAARGAGLDPNNTQLATAYLDLYNQSPTAAARFLDQIDYLQGEGISTQSLTELRFRSFVDVSTGERFRFSNGTLAGGGFANIARQNLGRTPTEAEVQTVIRADQSRRLRAMEGALPAATPVAAPAPRPAERPAGGPDEAPRFTSNRGIDLSPQTVQSANALYDSVRADTGYGIHVTSGRRDPARQAAAMYDNYADGTAPTYANRAAAAEVRAAYDAGRQAGEGRAATVARMAGVLQAQVDRGVLISRHLSSRAIDIRTPPAAQRNAVIAAIRDNPAVQSVQTENDHLHIQFR